MPSDLTTYDQAAVRVNGRYVAESTSVSVSYADSDQVVHLLGGGTKRTMVIAPGNRVMTIEWEMACPSDNTEDLRFIRQWRDVDLVKIGVDMFGSRLGISTTGYLRAPQLTGRVGSALVYKCAAICEVSDFLV